MTKRADFDQLYFSSGASVDQVKKDAKKINIADPSLTPAQARDRAAIEKHNEPDGYDAAIRKAQAFRDEVNRRFPDRGQNVLHCYKCPAKAVRFVLFGAIAACGLHANDPFAERKPSESESLGKIREGACCADSGCGEEATHHLGGVNFCEEHFHDRKSGNWYRRTLFGGDDD